MIFSFLGFVNVVKAADPSIIIISPGSVFTPTYVDQPYTNTFQVFGGTAPYTFIITSGILPTGLSLDSNTGTISGTPATVGTFNFTIKVTDVNSLSGSQVFTFTIAPPSPGFIYTRTPSGDPVSPPIDLRIQGVFGLEFCDARANLYRIVMFGSPFQISSYISHIPGQLVDDHIQFSPPPGTYSSIKLECYSNSTGSLGFMNLEGVVNVIPDTPTITSYNIIVGAVGRIFNGGIDVVGGQTPYVFSISAGNLPPGFDLDQTTGVLSGTPTTAGSFNFTVTVTSANSNQGSQAFTFNIAPSSPGFIYTRTPGGNPASPPFNLRIQGVFGLDFCGPNANLYRILMFGNPFVITGYISHVPGDLVDDVIQVDPSPGTYNSIQLECYSTSTGSLGFRGLEGSLQVIPDMPVITDFPIFVGSIGRSFFQGISVSGGRTPYTFSIASGTLPPGLSLDSSMGVISGVPTSIGSFGVTIQVTDSISSVGTKDFTINVAPLSAGFVYTRTPSGNPVSPPIDLRVQGVFGLDFCSPNANLYRILMFGNPFQISGYIAHTPGDFVDDHIQFSPPPGIYSSIQLECYSTSTGSLGFRFLEGSLTIPELTILTSTLLDANVGTAYSQTLQASGGTAPLAWSVSAGNLPTGLVLNSGTGVISGTPSTAQTVNFIAQVTDANNLTATANLSITVHGNTPTGSNVQVSSGNTTLTFSNVTQEGQTTVTQSSSGSQPPSGFKLGNPPTYYIISTTAIFTGQVEVCLSWTQGQFNNENNLKLFHFDGTNWTNITGTGYPDTVSNIICGLTTSFSDFAIFEKKQVVATIDIKPGSYPNSINLGSNGTVPVAILSTTEFDATTVDPLSVSLASAPVKLKGNGTAMYSFQDVNADNLLDLVVHVSTEALQLSEADEVANLIGYTLDVTEIVGNDTIRVVP